MATNIPVSIPSNTKNRRDKTILKSLEILNEQISKNILNESRIIHYYNNLSSYTYKDVETFMKKRKIKYTRIFINNQTIQNYGDKMVSLDWFHEAQNIPTTITRNHKELKLSLKENKQKYIRIKPINLSFNEFLPYITRLCVKFIDVVDGKFSQNDYFLGLLGVENMEIYNQMLPYNNYIEKYGVAMIDKLEKKPKIKDPALVELLNKNKITTQEYNNIRDACKNYNKANRKRKIYNLYNNQNSIVDKRLVNFGFKLIDSNGDRFYFIDNIDLLEKIIIILKTQVRLFNSDVQRKINKIVRVIQLQPLLDKFNLGYYILNDKENFQNKIDLINKNELIYLENMNIASLNKFLQLFTGKFQFTRSFIKDQFSVPIVGKNNYSIAYSPASASAYTTKFKNLTMLCNHPDLQKLTDHINDKNNSINENNYYKMVISYYLNLQEKEKIRFAIVIRKLQEKQLTVINYYTKFLNGKKYVKYRQQKLDSMSHVYYENKNIIDEIALSRDKFFEFEYIAFLYKISIAGLTVKKCNPILLKLNENHLYNTYCKPLLKTKLILIVWDMLLSIYNNILYNYIQEKEVAIQTLLKEETIQIVSQNNTYKIDYSKIVDVTIEDDLPILKFLTPLNDVEFSIIIPIVLIQVFQLQYDHSELNFHKPILKMKMMSNNFEDIDYYESAKKEYTFLQNQKVLDILSYYHYDPKEMELKPLNCD
jgi:hypothetical protein